MPKDKPKTIAVFFDDPQESDYPFNIENYRKAYHEFGECVARRGGQFLIVRSQQTYKGQNTFTNAWWYRGGTFVFNDESVCVDIIYNKGYFRADAGARIVNDPALDHLCTNKFETARFFGNILPKTVLVRSKAEVSPAVSSIGTEMVVIKPVDSLEGKGVFIGSPAEAVHRIRMYPYIIQEFVDSSGGIPDLVEGSHDLRIILIEGDIILSFIRIPPPGSLIANMARGGTKIEVSPEHLPPEAVVLSRNVDEHLRSFDKRVYSIDMVRRSDGTWKIIELNSKPGLNPASGGPGYKCFQERLADLLLR